MTSGCRGTPHFGRYGRELVSKPAISFYFLHPRRKKKKSKFCSLVVFCFISIQKRSDQGYAWGVRRCAGAPFSREFRLAHHVLKSTCGLPHPRFFTRTFIRRSGKKCRFAVGEKKSWVRLRHRHFFFCSVISPSGISLGCAFRRSRIIFSGSVSLSSAKYCLGCVPTQALLENFESCFRRGRNFQGPCSPIYMVDTPQSSFAQVEHRLKLRVLNVDASGV